MAANATTTIGVPALTNLVPAAPVTGPVRDDLKSGEQYVEVDGVLELSDGSAFRGFSFGAQGKSVAGECVFQTGEFALSYFFPIKLSTLYLLLYPSLHRYGERTFLGCLGVCGEFERFSEALSLSIFDDQKFRGPRGPGRVLLV
jgi:hypothetical protein